MMSPGVKGLNPRQSAIILGDALGVSVEVDRMNGEREGLRGRNVTTSIQSLLLFHHSEFKYENIYHN